MCVCQLMQQVSMSEAKIRLTLEKKYLFYNSDLLYLSIHIINLPVLDMAIELLYLRVYCPESMSNS